jgi:hypothetical protein
VTFGDDFETSDTSSDESFEAPEAVDSAPEEMPEPPAELPSEEDSEVELPAEELAEEDIPAEMPEPVLEEPGIEEAEEPLEELPEAPSVEPQKDSPEQPIEEPAEVPLEQPIETPVEELLEEPLEPWGEEPIEEPAETIPEQPIEAPVEELPEAPLDPMSEEPVEEPVEVPLEQPGEEPLEAVPEDAQEASPEQANEEPVEDLPEAPLDPAGEEPIEEPLEAIPEQPIEAPVEEQTEAPLDPIGEEPVEELPEASLEQPSEAPVGERSEEPLEQTGETPLDDLAEASLDPIGDEPVQEPAEIPLEQPTEEPIETIPVDSEGASLEQPITPIEELPEAPLEQSPEEPLETVPVDSNEASLEQPTDAPADPAAEQPPAQSIETLPEAPTADVLEQPEDNLQQEPVGEMPDEIFEQPAAAAVNGPGAAFPEQPLEPISEPPLEEPRDLIPEDNPLDAPLAELGEPLPETPLEPPLESASVVETQEASGQPDAAPEAPAAGVTAEVLSEQPLEAQVELEAPQPNPETASAELPQEAAADADQPEDLTALEDQPDRIAVEDVSEEAPAQAAALAGQLDGMTAEAAAEPTQPEADPQAQAAERTGAEQLSEAAEAAPQAQAEGVEPKIVSDLDSENGLDMDDLIPMPPEELPAADEGPDFPPAHQPISSGLREPAGEGFPLELETPAEGAPGLDTSAAEAPALNEQPGPTPAPVSAGSNRAPQPGTLDSPPSASQELELNPPAESEPGQPETGPEGLPEAPGESLPVVKSPSPTAANQPDPSPVPAQPAVPAAGPVEQPEMPPDLTTFTDSAQREIAIKRWGSDSQMYFRAYDTGAGPVPETISTGTAGFANVHVEQSESGAKVFKLQDILTPEEYRGAGIAGNMLNQVIAAGKSQGAAQIYGVIENQSAQDFWKGMEKHGWTIDPSKGAYGEVRYDLNTKAALAPELPALASAEGSEKIEEGMPPVPPELPAALDLEPQADPPDAAVKVPEAPAPLDAAQSAEQKETPAETGYLHEQNRGSLDAARLQDVTGLLQETEQGQQLARFLQEHAVQVGFGPASDQTVAACSMDGKTLTLNEKYAGLNDYELAAALVHESTHASLAQPEKSSPIPGVDWLYNQVNQGLYRLEPRVEEFAAFKTEADFWQEMRQKHNLPESPVADGAAELIYQPDGSLRSADAVFRDLHAMGYRSVLSGPRAEIAAPAGELPGPVLEGKTLLQAEAADLKPGGSEMAPRFESVTDVQKYFDQNVGSLGTGERAPALAAMRSLLKEKGVEVSALDDQAVIRELLDRTHVNRLPTVLGTVAEKSGLSADAAGRLVHRGLELATMNKYPADLVGAGAKKWVEQKVYYQDAAGQPKNLRLDLMFRDGGDTIHIRDYKPVDLQPFCETPLGQRWEQAMTQDFGADFRDQIGRGELKLFNNKGQTLAPELHQSLQQYLKQATLKHQHQLSQYQALVTDVFSIPSAKIGSPAVIPYYLFRRKG